MKTGIWNQKMGMWEVKICLNKLGGTGQGGVGRGKYFVQLFVLMEEFYDK